MGNNHASLQYRPDIDGLRALAILLVVGFHAFPSLVPFGFIGVDIFFVISGYLICGIILKNLKAGSFSWRGFYARRILRIFPGLALVLAACLICGYLFLYSGEFAQLGKHVFGGAFFIDNILLWHETGYFNAAAYAKPLLNLWSLGIEEQYYLFFPFALMLAARFRFNILAFILILAALSFIDNLYFSNVYPQVAFYNPLTRVWELLAGAALADLSARNGASHCGLRASCAGAALIIASAWLIRENSVWPGWLALLPVCGSLCLIAAGQDNWINRRLLSNSFAIFTGKISYVLYLWHWPLLSFAYIIYGNISEGEAALKAGLVALAYLLASLSYFFVETPFRFKFKSARQIKIKIAILLASVFGFGLCGLGFYLADGLPARAQFKNTQRIIDQLQIFAFKNEVAKRYLGEKADDLLYALYSDESAPETVAVIGDSHAGSAYHGIANMGRELGYNTLMLGQLLPGGERVKPEYGPQADKIMEIVRNDPAIRKVFISTRGALYFTKEHNRGERDPVKQAIASDIPPELFGERLQKMVDSLRAAGKQVYIIGENPELNIDAKDLFQRSLSSVSIKSDYKRTTREETLARQKRFLDLMRGIKGATFIDTIDKFCASGVCQELAEDGTPLYFDDDHLSEAGSDWQAREILKPWLTPDKAPIKQE